MKLKSNTLSLTLFQNPLLNFFSLNEFHSKTFSKTSFYKTFGFLFSFIGSLKERSQRQFQGVNRTAPSNNPDKKFSFKFESLKKAKKFIGLLFLFLVLGGLIYLFAKLPTSDEQRIQVMGAKATSDLNKELGFPLRDDKGEEISKITYIIEKAELRDEIIVDGKRATAVEGRTFLILTIKIVNNYNQSIQINSKDYVRLSVNGNKDEWLAPDINNDPVEVQAIATKYTRLGFPVNDSDKDLVLRVGEIKGDKEELPLNF